MLGSLGDFVAGGLLILGELGERFGQVAIAAQLLFASGEIRGGPFHVAVDLLLSCGGLAGSASAGALERLPAAAS